MRRDSTGRCQIDAAADSSKVRAIALRAVRSARPRQGSPPRWLPCRCRAGHRFRGSPRRAESRAPRPVTSSSSATSIGRGSSHPGRLHQKRSDDDAVSRSIMTRTEAHGFVAEQVSGRLSGARAGGGEADHQNATAGCGDAQEAPARSVMGMSISHGTGRFRRRAGSLHGCAIGAAAAQVADRGEVGFADSGCARTGRRRP